MREVAAWSRSPFRWTGSKKSLLPSLIRSCPDDFNTYIEPFAGSACLFFAIGPVKAILGDFNDELMRAYRVLARHPRRLARAVAALPVTTETYYADAISIIESTR